MPADAAQRERAEKLLAELNDVSDPAEAHILHIRNLSVMVKGEEFTPGTAEVALRNAKIYMDDLKRSL